MRRRVLLLLALVVAVAAALMVTQSGQRTSSDPHSSDIVRSNEVALVGSICAFSALVNQGELAPAKNLFWDRVHQPSHILAADLDTDRRSLAAVVLRTKGAVERDLATLTPALRASVPPFVDAVRVGLQDRGVPGAEKPCATAVEQ